MSKKTFIHDEDARTSLKAGVDKLAKIVGETLGPKGRNIIIQKSYGSPIITNDGVTIAKQIQLQDEFENVGATLCRQVAEKTHDNVGDGTTTATVLTQAIVDQGYKYIMSGINAIWLKRALDEKLQDVVKFIKDQSKEISSQRQIEHIATVSANNDVGIGILIAEAMKTVGKNGIINVEQNKSIDTQLFKVDGLEFDRGYISPYFINNQDKMSVEFDDALVLITDKKISAAKDMVKVLQYVSTVNKPLLIIADDVDGQALALNIVNNMRGTVRVVAVKAPMFGDRRKQMLDDIAVITGGVVIDENSSINFDNIDGGAFGEAKKIIVDKDSTIIREGGGDKEKIKERIKFVERNVELSKSEFEREKNKERLAKLTDSVAVIKVGATTETELMEKKARLDDSLHATRAAIQEGIVPGGGRVLLSAISVLKTSKNSSREEQIAVQILKEALEIPLKKIAENAGDSGEVIVEKVKSKRNIEIGYNALNGKIENLMEVGIVDPTKVVRNTIQNAVSIAGLILTTGSVIVEKVEQNANMNMDMGY